jgi:hypothetical protein
MATEHIIEGSRIRIGGQDGIEAVVSDIRPGRIEVVYLDPGGRALHREAVWRRGAWAFDGDDSRAAPADGSKRLEARVALLRRGAGA